jgi:hypothetical protein
MKERPILFSGPMVRALLAGTKTQTRRVVKPILSEREWIEERNGGEFWRCADGEPTCYNGVWETHEYAQQARIVLPYGQPGDRLWVRETFAPTALDGVYQYKASGGLIGTTWKPSIHMPKAASRITLEVTGVRVERLNDISHIDAINEGVSTLPMRKPENRHLTMTQSSYANLWEHINGPGSWDANPWVWVVEFKKV